MNWKTENRIIKIALLGIILAVSVLVGFAGPVAVWSYFMGLMVALLIQIGVSIMADNEYAEVARERREHTAAALADAEKQLKETLEKYGNPTLPPRG